MRAPCPDHVHHTVTRGSLSSVMTDIPHVPSDTPVVNCSVCVWDLRTCNTIRCPSAYRLAVRFLYQDGAPVLNETVTVTDVNDGLYSIARPLDGTGTAMIDPVTSRGPYRISLNGWNVNQWRRITPAVTGNLVTDRQAAINATTVCEIPFHDIEVINELGEPVLNRPVTLARTGVANAVVNTDAITGRLAGVAVGARITGVTIADIHDHFDGAANVRGTETHFAHI